ncbi:MAG: aquaporin family protein [Actinobacteria bacterium]|nr:aquaporin family protein [Actinomycetota bacterium]
MNNFTSELIGTAILIILGDGVVAGVLLARSKAQNSGWIVITFGWGLAVAMAVFTVGQFSGAHINPAVTLALAADGLLPWSKVPEYIVGQFAGAFIGAVLVWLAYLPHWEPTEDDRLKLAVYCTAPAIRNYPANVLTEIIGTFVLVFSVLGLVYAPGLIDSGLFPLLVGFLVVVIGISLGGPTGYAINPARDLGPRIAHFVLPIAGKGHSDWAYSWVPVVGPIVGGLLGGAAYKALFPAL